MSLIRMIVGVGFLFLLMLVPIGLPSFGQEKAGELLKKKARLVIGDSCFSLSGAKYHPTPKGLGNALPSSDDSQPFVVLFSPDKRGLGTLVVHHPAQPKPIVLKDAGDPYAIHPNQRLLVCMNSYKTIIKGKVDWRLPANMILNFWDLERKAIVHSMLKGQGVESFFFLPDENLAICTMKGTLVYDPVKKKDIVFLKNYRMKRLSSDQKRIAGFKIKEGAGKNVEPRTIVVLEVGSWKEVISIDFESPYMYQIEFSPLGDRLVGISAPNRSVRMWNLDTGTLMRLSKDVLTVPAAFSGNGKMVAFGSKDTIRLFALKDGTEIGQYKEKDKAEVKEFMLDHFLSVERILGVAFTQDSLSIRFEYDSQEHFTLKSLGKATRYINSWRKLNTVRLTKFTK